MYVKIVKPFFDISVSFVALVLLLPLIILIYILLRLSNTREPLFRQLRPGRNKRIFTILKFKTMTDDKNEQGDLLPDSERLTTLGNFLRKTSLDELPQLINVLKGDMSFVGPRPLRVRYLPFYTERESKRHDVKPGITGLAQVSGRNSINWDKRLEFDVIYVENIGFSYDLKILFKTVVKIFDSEAIEFSEGPDSLDEYRNTNFS
ncbi:MAG: sugar transferase [Pricia sp.]|nr:sugar transferase [Pricia sp.]